jgi:adhesin transport system outer membrane protein
MKNLKSLRKIAFAIFTSSVLVGCQHNVGNLDDKIANFEFPKLSFRIASTPANKDADQPITTSSEMPNILTYENFNNENYKNNIKVAIGRYPKLKSMVYQTKRASAGIKLAESGLNVQASSSLLAGVKSENGTSEPSAVASVRIGKLLYDFGSTDYAIESQKQIEKSAQLGELLAVEEIGLKATEAWINVARDEAIERIFERGISLATPLLGQIKNISTSGISDKKGLLLAKKRYSDLEFAYEQVKSTTLMNRAAFIEAFQGFDNGTIGTLDPLPVRDISKSADDLFINSVQLKYSAALIHSKRLEIEAIQASDKPQVSVSANATLPAENIKDDGVATVGFDVGYIFNDGGLKNAQIEMIKLEIKSLLEEKNATILSLKTELDVLNQIYVTASKKITVSQELLSLAEEVRETAKAQLVSGRSSIQDVMNAEVDLAEAEIAIINAKTEATLASYKILVLGEDFSNYIGWHE